MIKLSDTIRHLPFNDFKFTDNFYRNIENYIESKKTPQHMRNLNNNIYVTALFRLGFGKNIVLHTLTDGVIKKILRTSIEDIPNEIPKFMKRSFLIEAPHDKTLFGDIYSIGGFTYKEEICLLIGTKDSFYTQHEKASFDGRKLKDLNLVLDPVVYSNKKFTQLKSRKDTFAFIIILSLMLEAERTPLVIEYKKNKTKPIHSVHKSMKDTDYITRRIYIDKDIRHDKTIVKDNSDELDKTDRQLKDINVRGFLRRQHYGKNLELIKWIYIESFDSKRWTKNKDKKIIVDLFEK